MKAIFPVSARFSVGASRKLVGPFVLLFFLGLTAGGVTAEHPFPGRYECPRGYEKVGEADEPCIYDVMPSYGYPRMTLWKDEPTSVDAVCTEGKLVCRFGCTCNWVPRNEPACIGSQYQTPGYFSFEQMFHAVPDIRERTICPHLIKFAWGEWLPTGIDCGHILPPVDLRRLCYTMPESEFAFPAIIPELGLKAEAACIERCKNASQPTGQQIKIICCNKIKVPGPISSILGGITVPDETQDGN